MADSDDDNGKLSWKERRFLALLGLPAFGISLAYTAATTYLPVIIERLSGPTGTGIIIGIEGSSPSSCRSSSGRGRTL